MRPTKKDALRAGGEGGGDGGVGDGGECVWGYWVAVVAEPLTRNEPRRHDDTTRLVGH